MKAKVVVTALLAMLVTVDQAMAGGWFIIPTPVPELDGSGAITAMALLASVAAIVFNRSK